MSQKTSVDSTASLPQQSDFVIDCVYKEKLSRLFIFRGLWMYIVFLVMIFRIIWVGIISFIHLWYKLFLGKRKESWWKIEVKFYKYMVRWQAYMTALVDERPKVIED